MSRTLSPSVVVATVTCCTALALFGDATMYAVLPSRYALAGVAAGQVGWLLSVNRLVRIPLNVPSGRLSDRVDPRLPYLVGLLLGTASTLGYGLTSGFWPLLVCRALWGLAWALLIVASYEIVLRVSSDETRGRWTGVYSALSFFGGSIGAMFGGFLVESVPFGRAMLVLGGCTSLSVLGGLWLWRAHLPEPPRRDVPAISAELPAPRLGSSAPPRFGPAVRLILLLSLLHRLIMAGVFNATFGRYLLVTFGEELTLFGAVIGIASLTGTLLFVRNVLTTLVGPLVGWLSDRLGHRLVILFLGEVAGAIALVVLAASNSLWLLAPSILLIAVTYGLVPPLLMAWIGDISAPEGRATVVGAYQTLGDIGSGLGPLLAYALIAHLDIRAVYLGAAIVVAAIAPLILRMDQSQRGRP